MPYEVVGVRGRGRGRPENDMESGGGEEHEGAWIEEGGCAET